MYAGSNVYMRPSAAHRYSKSRSSTLQVLTVRIGPTLLSLKGRGAGVAKNLQEGRGTKGLAEHV